jgi:DNA-binding IscR family transcriptional regulator
VGVGGDGHVFEDFALVPDVVAGGDDVGSEVEEFFGDGGGDAETAGGVLAVDDEEVDGVGFHDVGEVFADDVAAGGAKDIADEEDIHFEILHGCRVVGDCGLARIAWIYADGCVGLCGSFLCMAQSERFQLSVRVLAVLASEPDTMHTSAAIAETLGESAVMVRRMFLLLHKAGLIVQRKGPHGGAKLKVPAKQIGLGDLFEATAGDWFSIEDKAVAGWIKKVKGDAVAAMNEHSLAGVVKRMKKGK